MDLKALLGGVVPGSVDPVLIETTPQLQGFVVIVTYGRSGSTLIQSLLNSIDGWCIRGENDNGLGPLASAWGNLKQSKHLARMRVLGLSEPDDPWAGAELIDADSFGRELADTFLRNVLQPPAGTRVAGFKEIRCPLDDKEFTNTLEFICRFFPKTRFVFNLRNHESVSRSAWWANREPDEVFARLRNYESVFTKYTQENPDRCIQIHYDEYTRNPGSLEPLFSFLGEAFDGDLVRRVLSKPLRHLK